MHILLVALGTRGDVQPVLAVGKALQHAGHFVKVVAGTNFEEWIRSHGLDFAGTLDMEAMMQSKTGVKWVENGMNPRRQLAQMKALLQKHSTLMTKPLVENAPHADLIVGGFISEPFVQTISEKFNKRTITLLLQPYRPTRSGTATMQPVFPTSYNTLNRWVGYLAEWLLWGVAADAVNSLRRELGLPPHNAHSYTLTTKPTPTIIGVSHHVVPPAPDWHPHVHLTGYWFLEKQAMWQPPANLHNFLEAGPPPLYIGFGSMSSKDPQQTAVLVQTALKQAGQRGILAKGWAGHIPLESDSDLYLLDRAPHDLLFPHMAGVVHHGGAGTTAAGLRAGKPTFIIPHMADQPYWGRRICELGVGPKPVSRPHLTIDKLATGIHTIATNTKMRDGAEALGEKIRREDGVAEAVGHILRIVEAH